VFISLAGSAGIAFLEFLTEFHGPEDQKQGANQDEREADERRNQAADGQDREDDSRQEGDAHGFGGFGSDVVVRVGFNLFDGLPPIAAGSGFSNGFVGHLHGKNVMGFCDDSGKPGVFQFFMMCIARRRGSARLFSKGILQETRADGKGRLSHLNLRGFENIRLASGALWIWWAARKWWP
jgi:hypothetical protein